MGDALQHIDENMLTELRDVMEEDFPLLIETFLRDSLQRLAAIREAFQNVQAREFSRACHTLKGSCINLGLDRLADLCRQGELMGGAGELGRGGALLEEMDAEYRIVRELLAPLT